VFVNGIEASADELVPLRTAMTVDPPPGHYWYDRRSGLWGLKYGPAVGFLDANLALGGSHAMDEDVSRGKTHVVLNGRRLRDEDLLLLKGIGFPCAVGRWWMDADGNYGEEMVTTPPPVSSDGNRAALKGSASFLSSSSVQSFKRSLQEQQEDEARHNAATFKVTVPSFRKVSERVVAYEIVITLEGGSQALEWKSERRFSDLQAFHRVLRKRFPGMEVPSLPPSVSINMMLESFLEQRRSGIESYLAEVVKVREFRECREAWSQLGIFSTLEDPELAGRPKKAAARRQDWSHPLRALSDAERNKVADLFIYVGSPPVLWPDGLLRALLKRLELMAYRSDRDVVVHPPEELVQLDENDRWGIIWEMLVQSLVLGGIDARVHVSIHRVADFLGFGLEELGRVESECAEFLRKQLTNTDIDQSNLKKSTKSKNRNVKVGLAAAVGGGLLVAAGIIASPLLIPVIIGGAVIAAGAVAALPLVGAGLATGVVLGGGILAITSPAVIPLVFGATGAGLASYNVALITEGLSEFFFVPVPVSDVDDDGDGEVGDPYFIDSATGEVREEHLSPEMQAIREQKLAEEATTGNEQASDTASAHRSGSAEHEATPTVGAAAPPIVPHRPAPTPPSAPPQAGAGESGAAPLPAVPSRLGKPVPRPPSLVGATAVVGTRERAGSLSAEEKLKRLPAPPDISTKPLPPPPGATGPASAIKQGEESGGGWKRKLSSAASLTSVMRRKDSSGSAQRLDRSASNSSESSTGAASDTTPDAGVPEDSSSATPLPSDDAKPGMQVFICVNGWLWKESDITSNWNTVQLLNPAAEVYSLKWETKELAALGRVRRNRS